MSFVIFIPFLFSTAHWGATGKLQLEDNLRQFLLVQPTPAKRPADLVAENPKGKRGGGRAAAAENPSPPAGNADEKPCITHYCVAAIRSPPCVFGTLSKFSHRPMVLLKKSAFTNTGGATSLWWNI